MREQFAPALPQLYSFRISQCSVIFWDCSRLSYYCASFLASAPVQLPRLNKFSFDHCFRARGKYHLESFWRLTKTIEYGMRRDAIMHQLVQESFSCSRVAIVRKRREDNWLVNALSTRRRLFSPNLRIRLEELSIQKSVARVTLITISSLRTIEY